MKEKADSIEQAGQAGRTSPDKKVSSLREKKAKEMKLKG